jgi:hypothetical protein
MASAGGLTRRRGGGRVAGADENDDSRVSSPISRNGSSLDNRIPETSFTSTENGHKIAFDPRDLSETEERSKQPKLTLMEEVLLLGLKDKQVSPASLPGREEWRAATSNPRMLTSVWRLCRAISPFGTRTFRTL